MQYIQQSQYWRFIICKKLTAWKKTESNSTGNENLPSFHMRAFSVGHVVFASPKLIVMWKLDNNRFLHFSLEGVSSCWKWFIAYNIWLIHPIDTHSMLYNNIQTLQWLSSRDPHFRGLFPVVRSNRPKYGMKIVSYLASINALNTHSKLKWFLSFSEENLKVPKCVCFW